MDVDTELFTLASETSQHDILIIPEPTLIRLNVVNNGRKKPRWTIESLPDAVYLKGEQHTMYGMNKFLVVFPAAGDVMLHIIFEAGPNAEDAMKMEADRLVVGDEYIPMREKRVGRLNDHGMINATYVLDDGLLAKIASAKRLGIMLQWSENAPIFLGFDSMPFEEGAEKLPGLLAIYRRGHA